MGADILSGCLALLVHAGAPIEPCAHSSRPLQSGLTLLLPAPAFTCTGTKAAAAVHPKQACKPEAPVQAQYAFVLVVGHTQMSGALCAVLACLACLAPYAACLP